MAKSAVADAAPIIAFACIGRLALLPQVLGQVLVPETVARECLVTGQPGAEAIGKALAANLLIRHPDAEPAGSAFPQLDAGETAAIRLARSLKATLLIDERLGRAVARRLGVPVIGSLGVLIAGKRLVLIESVGSIITQMRENGYYIADALVSEALLRAGELER